MAEEVKPGEQPEAAPEIQDPTPSEPPEGFTPEEWGQLSDDDKAIMLEGTGAEDKPKPGEPEKEVKGKEGDKTKTEAATGDGDDTFTFKADGKEHSVSREKALELMSKGFDYTKKTMSLSEARKQMEEDPLGFLEKNEGIRNRLMEQWRQSQEPPKIPILDPENPESVKQHQEALQAHIQHGVATALESIRKQGRAGNRLAQELQSVNESRAKKGQEPLTKDEIVEVASYAKENGINSFRAAYRDKNFEDVETSAYERGVQSTADQIERAGRQAGTKLPKGGQGGPKEKKSLSDLTDDDISNLSDEELNRLAAENTLEV